MAGYAKLFNSILTSTIWGCEDHATRVVWISLLAAADADGIVEGSIPGFARVANVTREEFERALKVLTSPDPDSRTPDHEGRRIEVIQGGWRLLNHGKYRAQPEAGEGSRAPYYRDYRARKKAEAERAEAPSSPVAPRAETPPHSGSRVERELVTTVENYGQTVWTAWLEDGERKATLVPTPTEHAIIRSWEMREKVPLRVVLRAMKDTKGAKTAKSLAYLVDPVREAQERWRKSQQT